VLPNGLILCLDLALRRAATAERPGRERYAALVLGLFREDVILVPGLGIALPSPSLGHIYPLSRRHCAALFREAVRAARSGDRLRGDFLLGRALHVLIDMACPTHAQAVSHYLTDPFELAVDARAEELAKLPLPELPEAVRAGPVERLIDSLAGAARREHADGTKSPWGRALKRLGLARAPTGAEVMAQARRLIPLAAAHVRALLARYDAAAGDTSASPLSPRHPVLVVGAGPAGLAAAACLKREGVPFRLVDRRGTTGGAYNHIYPGITLLSPTRYTGLPGLALHTPGEYVTVPEYRAYLARYAAHHGLSAERAEVRLVERQGQGFLVYFADGGAAAYPAVVVATGMYDQPVRPDIPGLPADGPAAPGRPEVLHTHDWPGPAAFRGRRLLIVGAASSGVEVAEECARAGVPVVVAARRGARLTPQRILGRDIHDWAYLFFERLPRWLLGSYCDRRPTLPGEDIGFSRFRRDGLIAVRGAVTRFEGTAAVFAGGARQEFDAVALATGYRFVVPFLPPEVSRAPAGHPLADEGESRSWLGLYFVGMPCQRTLASEFLRGIRDDAPVVAGRVRRRLRALPGRRG
jgi:putative flavoprotein involved in K+ transport